MTRDVLIINTSFFPDPAVGAVRINNWCRMLPERGWRPTVLCRHYGPTATPELLAEHFDPYVSVRYVNQPGEGAAPIRSSDARLSALGRAWKLRVGRSILGRVTVPDLARAFWVRSIPLVFDIIRETRPELIITSGPPFSVHTVGQAAKRTLGLPWIADFQDPYVIDVRFQPGGLGALLRPRHRAFERGIYDEADAVTHAIDVHYRFARLAYPGARQRCFALTHPCPDDLADGRVEPESAESGRKSVRVVGVIGDAEALSLAEAIEDMNDVELKLIGPIPSTAQRMNDLLGDRLILTGRLRHDLAKRHIAGADVLVSYLSPDRSRYLGVSSKLFEFVAAGKPIIEINPTFSDRRLLRSLPGVIVLNRPSRDEIRSALNNSLRPEAADAMARDAQAVAFRARHSWDAHADRLSELLRIVADKPRA